MRKKFLLMFLVLSLFSSMGGGYLFAQNGNVAKIGDTEYATFADALDAVNAGETLTLLADINLSEILVLDKAITLDGNDKTLTSTAGRAINVSGADGVTIKNLTINASGERAINVIQNATNVTIDNVTATAANYTVNVAASAPNAVVAIKNSTLNGLCTVNVSAAGAGVTIEGSTVNCNDNNTTAGESYAALCLNKEAVGGSIVATNSTINVTEGSDSMKGRNGAEGGTVTINGSTEGVAVMVAVITYEGSTYYYSFETLAAAVEYAKAGDVVTLIRDVTVAEKITIAKSITLDGNGKTITYTGNGASARAIDVPSTDGVKLDVTIKNLTVDCTSSYCQRGINYNEDGKLTLEGVTVKGTNVTYALNLPGSSDNCEVAINNSSLTGNIALNVWGANAIINATDSDFTSVDNATHENYAAVKLNNNGTDSAEGAKINITGGSITAKDENEQPSSATTNATATGVINISETTEVTGNIETIVAIVTYEGASEFYGCFTLQEAIDKAGDDNRATVKLLSDIETSELIKVEKAVVLDLNGKTVTANCKKAFEVYANATIKNGTISSQQRCVDTRKAVELTLEDLKLNAIEYYSAWGNQQPLTIGGSADGTIVNMTNVDINAGTIGYAIISFVETNLTATNSNFSGYSALYVKEGSEESEFKFEGSTLKGDIGSNDVEGNSFATIATEANNVTVTLDANSILESVGQNHLAISVESEGNVITVAGDIEATNFLDGSTNVNANTIKVKAEYADELLAEGYATIEADDNDLVEVSGPAVAKIGETGYATLQEAFNAATEGQTVTVINDVELENTVTVAAGKVVTLDLNGKDINVANDQVNFNINGKLTLNDETGEGVFTSRNHFVNEGAEFIVNAGTVQNVATAEGGFPINLNGGSVTINGGTVQAVNNANYAIGGNGGTLVINDGTVKGNWGAVNLASGNAIIKDGTLEVTGTTGGHALYVAGDTQVTIEGGEFKPYNGGGAASYALVLNDGNPTVNVSGGMFHKGWGCVIVYAGNLSLTGGTFGSNMVITNNNPLESADINTYCAEGYAALPDLNGNFIVGTKPTATVNNLGSVTIPAGEYSIWNGSFDQNTEDDGDMPLSFVMQFLADQDAEDMATSPFADWYGDFVITFTGIENGSFTADGCYLAGHYGSFGWVKIPVDGMKIEEGVHYPVMLGVGMGQKYNYICSSVEDFKCALYLTDGILAANPNIKVNLELAIVDNSKGSDAAASALVNNTNVYEVVDYDYDAIDFNMNYVARIGDKGYETLAAAVEAAQPNETIELINNAKGNGIVINKSLTIDFAGFAYTFVEQGVGDTQTKSNGFQIKKDNNVTLMNGTLNVDEDWKEKFYILIQNYSNLTVENMKLDGTNLDMWSATDGDSYVISNNSGNVNITGNTKIIANDYSSVTPSKAFAFDACDQTSKGYALPVVTVNTTGAVTGAVEVSATLNITKLGEGSEISYISIDGDGQLFHNGLTTTIKKHITGHPVPENNSEYVDGWYTISSPVGTVGHDKVDGLLNGTHDLYRYDEPTMMWENVKDATNEDFTTLEAGRGYIYANTATTTLSFTGDLVVEAVEQDITATDNELTGFNLIGNPFTHNITLDHISGASLADGFYTLTNEGAWNANNSTTGVINAFQGALIQTAATNKVEINPTAVSKSRAVNNGQLKINVANSKYNDVAYVSFNEGIGLDKIEHRNANIPMVYVPVDGVNYAVAMMSQDVTEIPVSFRAMTMGQYTIGAEAQDCEYAMMTLVDRLTGTETNLLLEDYTFVATTKDNADRFIIKLAKTNADGENEDNFAFINNGMMYIYNIEGQGMVSIYDVTGRPVAEFNVETSANIPTSELTTGIYIIRMTDNNGVKVQKILID